MARGLSTELYKPIITATLKQMVIGLQFVGHGVDNLSTACQPFLVSYARNYQQLASTGCGEYWQSTRPRRAERYARTLLKVAGKREGQVSPGHDGSVHYVGPICSVVPNAVSRDRPT